LRIDAELCHSVAPLGAAYASLAEVKRPTRGDAWRQLPSPACQLGRVPPQCKRWGRERALADRIQVREKGPAREKAGPVTIAVGWAVSPLGREGSHPASIIQRAGRKFPRKEPGGRPAETQIEPDVPGTPLARFRFRTAIKRGKPMQKLLEVVEIWSALSLATFAFILWYRSQPNRHRQ
jgi:hypothetical protein